MCTQNDLLIMFAFGLIAGIGFLKFISWEVEAINEAIKRRGK